MVWVCHLSDMYKISGLVGPTKCIQRIPKKNPRLLQYQPSKICNIINTVLLTPSGKEIGLGSRIVKRWSFIIDSVSIYLVADTFLVKV